MDMDHPPGRTYRYLTQVPLFAFGFGLSFGRFTYSEASVLPSALPASSAAHVIVCAHVVNSEHALAADDVAQVYARVAVCPNNVHLQSAPLSQLVAFNRTTVMKPGEQQQVCLTVTLEPFRLMDTRGNYAVQPCTYELSIGSISPGAQGVFVVPEPLSHCKVNITLT
jgi:beta-glucosidase